MKHESITPQEIPATYIQDQGLAEEMAYGEKPHRELAALATQVGLTDEATAQASKAEQAGVEAGRSYIAGLTVNLEAGVQDKAETKVAAAKASMAEKFGVKEEDFSLISYEQDGKTINTVVYAAAIGIDLGDSDKDYDQKRSWNSIFDKDTPENFMVEVDGQLLDARTGMTRLAYDALYQDAKGKGTTLPDSEQSAKENDDVWTWTLLKDAEADRDGYVLGAYVFDGEVTLDEVPSDASSRDVRFRPAVVIE